ncbi:SHOCT domain-containing protein [Niabella insulamsoli]|uniref:SHOCT domain-containing protein n=1 Tax=Niabella insulamsoli TaxID=3144874 RepID=UPI0031FBABB1
MRMMIIIALLVPGSIFAQKFLVVEDDSRINERIANRIMTLGYSVVKEGDKADFVAQMIYEKRKGYMSLKTGWKNKDNKYNKVGYVAFLNMKGDTLSATEEQGGYARYYNTYTALSELTNKILQSDFNTALKDALKSYTPKKETHQNTSKADEIAKLKKLLDEGALTKEEFEAEKKKLLEK